MAWFKIYAGMGGGFGGANYQGTYEYNDEKEACDDAYRMAEEEYQSYEGYHGIMSWEDCRQDLLDSLGEEPDEEDVDLHYREAIEGWISYYVRPATSEHDTDDEES